VKRNVKQTRVRNRPARKKVEREAKTAAEKKWGCLWKCSHCTEMHGRFFKHQSDAFECAVRTSGEEEPAFDPSSGSLVPVTVFVCSKGHRTIAVRAMSQDDVDDPGMEANMRSSGQPAPAQGGLSYQVSTLRNRLLGPPLAEFGDAAWLAAHHAAKGHGSAMIVTTTVTGLEIGRDFVDAQFVSEPMDLGLS